MQNKLLPLAKAVASASLLSVGLSACVAGNGDQSSSTQTSTAPSSEAQSSSVTSSVAPSSSSVMSSSSSVAPSSSSVMSSSSVAVSSAAADCSEKVALGSSIYNASGFSCATCHGAANGPVTSGEGMMGGPIDTLNAPYEGSQASQVSDELNVFIASYMGNFLPGAVDKAVEAEAVAAYLYDAAGSNWCAKGAESSSSAAPVSSSSVASSSSSVASTDFEVLYAINAGGSAVSTQGGIDFDGDFYVTGGTAGGPANNLGYVPWSDGTVVPNQDLDLFRTERWGESTYNFPLKDGSYNVTIYMLEGYNMIQAPGQRVFDVLAEGQLVADDVDIYALAGARDIAYSMSFDGIQVNDGNLTLEFTKVVEQPSIRAIIIEGAPGSKEEYVPDPGSVGSATVPAGCSGNATLTDNDFVLFDGISAFSVAGGTIDLHGNWKLDEAWAVPQGAKIEVKSTADGSAISYSNAGIFTGFKFTPPSAFGSRSPFKITGMDLWVQVNSGSPQFGVRVIKPGEDEGNGGASTTTWMRNSNGQQDLTPSTSCQLMSLTMPQGWDVNSQNANRFILEVKNNWNNSHELQVRRMVIKGFSYAQ